jgi:hypothetical protein
VQVRLLFVGPDLPASLHLASFQAGHDLWVSGYKVSGPACTADLQCGT